MQAQNGVLACMGIKQLLAFELHVSAAVSDIGHTCLILVTRV